MLLLLMTLMMQDLIEEAKALGEPYTVWKCIKDLLIICLLMSIEFFIFIGSGIILHTPNIQQGEAWVNHTREGAGFCFISVRSNANLYNVHTCRHVSLRVLCSLLGCCTC